MWSLAGQYGTLWRPLQEWSGKTVAIGTIHKTVGQKR